MSTPSPTPEQARKCSNCMWWTYQAERWGVCRGAPPQLSLVNGAFGTLWPETDAFDWCGSFRMKEPTQVITIDGPLTVAEHQALRDRMKEPGQ